MKENTIHLTYEQFWEMVSALKMTSSIYQAYSKSDDLNFEFLGGNIEDVIDNIETTISKLERYTLYFDPDDKHVAEKSMELSLIVDAPAVTKEE